MPISFKQSSALLCAAALFVTNYSSAEQDPFSPGFGGTISINLGYGESQSQHNLDDDNAITADLNNQGKKSKQAAPFFLGRLQYSFGTTLIYLGNSEEQITEAQFQAELGIAHQLSRDTVFTAALFGNIPGMDEIWQDPYLTGQKRSKTEQDISGARFALEMGAPLPLTLKYAIAESTIENDAIGVSQGLTVQQLTQLARESRYQRFGAEISLPLSQRFILSPAFYYTLRDAEGAAKSHQLLSAQLSFVINASNHSFVTTLRRSEATFDASNPVFARKQDYQDIGIFSVYSYAEPFAWRNVQLHAMAGYQTLDSDIDFYDSQSTFVSTGISYSF
ncbi:DUF2860 domain-containing protein [Vibrio vulnificus]|nr:DUF2860 domain-containing protein [Vibrio vulnificus]